MGGKISKIRVASANAVRTDRSRQYFIVYGNIITLLGILAVQCFFVNFSATMASLGYHRFDNALW